MKCRTASMLFGCLFITVVGIKLSTSQAWLHNSVSVFGGSRLPSASALCRSRKTVCVHAFPWFGGDDASVEGGKEKGGSDENQSSTGGSSLADVVGVANIMDSMSGFKTSQRIGDRTSAILADLSANVLVEGLGADGKVRVSYDGQQQPIGVNIDEAYFESLQQRKEGASELGVALTEALRDAHKKSATKMEEKMKGLYSDFGFDTAAEV